MYGRSEIDIKFPTPIPVNITTRRVRDDAGKLQLRKDVTPRRNHAGAASHSRSKIWKAWSHTPSRATAGRDGNLPAGVNFASDSTFSSGPSFSSDLRSSKRLFEGDGCAPVPRGSEYRNGGVRPLIFLPRSTSDPNSPA